jgi:pimeloyl-ACP methyl ester carboxylesterase
LSPTLPATTDVAYRTVAVDGIDIFYREAGPADGPTVLLLHGWPTSSHMFRDLIPKLADRFRLIAPDYPGFGFSSQPSASEFAYTFDALANVVDGFIDALGITKLSMYVQDYGGPIGMRIATKNDPFFTPAGAEAIGRDNPHATVVPLEGGHFALEEHSTRIAAEMRSLADRVVAGVYAD